MKSLAYNFNRAFPALASTEFFGGCTISEPLNYGTDKFQELQIQGIDGFLFPHDLSSKASSFAKKCRGKSCLYCDCDGIMLIERSGKKYLVVCELKSSFDSDEIAHAKDQLVGSYIKMVGILSTLQNFNRDEYEVRGVIASFEPSDEAIDALTKCEGDPKKRFTLRLANDKKYMMPSIKCQKSFSPFDVRDFEIFYVPVPNRSITHTIDLPSLLGI